MNTGNPILQPFDPPGRVAAARIGAYYHHLYGLAREYVAVKDVACALVAEP